jgi:hypothetical protein
MFQGIVCKTVFHEIGTVDNNFDYMMKEQWDQTVSNTVWPLSNVHPIELVIYLCPLIKSLNVWRTFEHPWTKFNQINIHEIKLKMPFTICCTGNTSQSEKPDGAIKNGQSRETGNTRHVTKTKKNTTSKTGGEPRHPWRTSSPNFPKDTRHVTHIANIYWAPL